MLRQNEELAAVFVELEDLLARDESFAAQAGKRPFDGGVLGVVDPLVAVFVWLDVVDLGNDVVGGRPLPGGFEFLDCAQISGYGSRFTFQDYFAAGFRGVSSRQRRTGRYSAHFDLACRWQS